MIALGNGTFKKCVLRFVIYHSESRIHSLGQRLVQLDFSQLTRIRYILMVFKIFSKPREIIIVEPSKPLKYIIYKLLSKYCDSDKYIIRNFDGFHKLPSNWSNNLVLLLTSLSNQEYLSSNFYYYHIIYKKNCNNLKFYNIKIDGGTYVVPCDDSLSYHDYSSIFVKEAVTKESGCVATRVQLNAALFLDENDIQTCPQIEPLNFKNYDVARNLIIKKLLTEIGICLFKENLKETSDMVENCLLYKNKDLLETFPKDSILKTQHFFYIGCEKIVPMCYLLAEDKEFFDIPSYFNNLKNTKIGQPLLLCEKINSTLELCNNLHAQFPDLQTFCILSDSCTGSIGRSGNRWISPKGSISFTLFMILALGDFVSKELVWFQHTLAVSLTKVLRYQTFYTMAQGDEVKFIEVPFNIKWPNDILYDGLYKIGGIMARAVSTSQNIELTLSFGLNYLNKDPTVGLAEIAKIIVEQEGKSQIYFITSGQFLAKVLDSLSHYIDLINMQGGPRALKSTILPEYYSLWLHGNKEITLIERNGEKAKVVGLDEYGYLKVQLLKEPHQIIALTYDETSLDVTSNTINKKI